MKKVLNGAPIFKTTVTECPYYIENNTKKGESAKFSTCSCPSRIDILKEKHTNSIVSCGEDYNDCCIHNAQSEKDIKTIEKFIDSKVDNGWLLIEDVDKNKLEKTLDKKNDFLRYLNALLNYNGLYLTTDDNVDGLLYTTNITTGI